MAAEVFFSSYWKSRYQHDVIVPTSKNNEGWDFRTQSHQVEVKTAVGQVVDNSIKYQITKLQNKQESHLCTVLDAPDNEHCYIGMAIPPEVWTPLMTDGGRITLSFNQDFTLTTLRPDVVSFMHYHTLYNKTTLRFLFDLISKEIK
jgi:hypothetical protein